MKHIEVSKKITLRKEMTVEELKQALVGHIEKAIEIESVSDGVNLFTLKGTTGSPAGFTRHTRLDLDVSIDYDKKDQVARVIMSGYARTARSLSILYFFYFMVLLMVGLLPGSFETSAETSGAADMIVFLFLGVFIVFDIYKKHAETKDYLDTALESLNTTIG